MPYIPRLGHATSAVIVSDTQTGRSTVRRITLTTSGVLTAMAVTQFLALRASLPIYNIRRSPITYAIRENPMNYTNPTYAISLQCHRPYVIRAYPFSDTGYVCKLIRRSIDSLPVRTVQL